MTSYKRLSLMVLACCTSVLSANIIITEIMYNPAGIDVSGNFAQEWVEIYNTGNTTVDLTGWMLRDEDSNAGNWGTLSGSLGPGQVGVITTSTSEAFKASWPSAANAVIFTVPGWGSLANTVNEPGNEVVTILDNLANVIDIADYLTVAPWPSAQNGASIYLLPGFMTAELNDDGANWAPSVWGVDGAVFPVLGTDPFDLSSVGSPGIVVIPEPGTFALVLGFCGLVLLQLRRRRQS